MWFFPVSPPNYILLIVHGINLSVALFFKTCRCVPVMKARFRYPCFDVLGIAFKFLSVGYVAVRELLIRHIKRFSIAIFDCRQRGSIVFTGTFLPHQLDSPQVSLMTVADLFDPEPEQWGLRGDPYLWREMKKTFAETQLTESRLDIRAEIERAFHSIVGVPLSDERDMHYVERYTNGGMSSGQVCFDFWKNRALSILSFRYANSQGL